MDPHVLLVMALADRDASALVRRAIHRLSRIAATGMAGEDSGLQTLWDEICVQVQLQESVFWAAYEARVHGVLAALLATQDDLAQRALWLQTREGESWYAERDDSDEVVPCLADDIVELLRERLYGAAADWSNERIRAYLERSVLD